MKVKPTTTISEARNLLRAEGDFKKSDPLVLIHRTMLLPDKFMVKDLQLSDTDALVIAPERKHHYPKIIAPPLPVFPYKILEEDLKKAAEMKHTQEVDNSPSPVHSINNQKPPELDSKPQLPSLDVIKANPQSQILMEMGFKPAVSFKAIMLTNGNIEAALQALLSGDITCTEEEEQAVLEASRTNQNNSSPCTNQQETEPHLPESVPSELHNEFNRIPNKEYKEHFLSLYKEFENDQIVDLEMCLQIFFSCDFNSSRAKKMINEMKG